MYCQKCGKENPDQSQFCAGCGAPLNADAPGINPSVPSQQSEPPKKKKKGKGCLTAVIVVVVIFILGIILLSFGGKDDSKVPVDVNGQTGSGTSEQVNNSSKTKVEIDEQIIFDSKSIKVTATSIDVNGLFGADIKVLIENNSTSNITVQAKSCYVNDVNVGTLFSADVAAGKKSNDSITLESSDLKAANITTIKDIELVLHIFDSDSWNTIIDSDVIKIATSADKSYVQTYDDSGIVAYENSQFKIVVKKLNSSDSFWGSDVYLYIENNSDKDVTIQAKDVSINGFMVDPAFSCEVRAGKKAFDTITFFESDLTDNSITDITKIELKFHIFNTETWDAIKDTDTITINF